MALNRGMIAVVALVLLATTLIVSSMDYSSSVITTGSEPSGGYKFVGKDEGPLNHTSGNGTGTSEHESEKNGGNATDPFNGLFGREPGDSNPPDAADSGNSLFLIGTAVVFIAVIVIVTFVIIRRRRHRNATNSPAPQPVAVTAPPCLPDSHEGIFRLQFPQICEPFPLTWEVGEPLEMIVTRNDRTTADARLSIDGSDAGTIRLENGKATVPLKLAKGIHKVAVSPDGNGVPGSESWVNLRIVDYREEVVRMFNEMCHRFLPATGEAGCEMTPREIGLSIGAQLPESKQKLLDMAVTAFERANYSLHDVCRTDYEIMYTSERGVA